MQVRFPQFDYSQFRAHWARNPEFAQAYNAFSVVPAHIEPYLVKVMMRARQALDRSHEQLHQEMQMFIRQEVQHNKQHVAFNNCMYEAGYDALKPIEAEYAADYAAFVAKRSLKFNLAYCEGFEALGCAAAELWFRGDIDELLEGADAYAAELWRWHLAEEFEHRTVCFDAFKALYAKGWWQAVANGYFYRVWAFFYAVRHINGYLARCEAALLAKDRAAMTDAELKQSRQRQRAAKNMISRATLPRLLRVLSPFYNPRKKQETASMRRILNKYAGQT